MQFIEKIVDGRKVRTVSMETVNEIVNRPNERAGRSLANEYSRGLHEIAATKAEDRAKFHLVAWSDSLTKSDGTSVDAPSRLRNIVQLAKSLGVLTTGQIVTDTIKENGKPTESVMVYVHNPKK